MNSSEIRTRFLEYFKRQGHTIVASSPLVPGNDPTLLFTNAGMVQFKDVFLGQDKRPYVRATTSQRCVRAGGKHNDLENVGYTARHHTFFEMLGNFSFGDYFKRDAIRFSWELLTKEYGLDPSRMWVTVHQTDDEAYDIWANEIKVPKERIARIGDKPGGSKFQSDNFWQMGDTGPCGPCTEIFWDHGPGIPGGPPGTPEADGDRYIEIWNLVFMQFNRDESGAMHPLPKPSVDTGMGLERIAAVLQGVHSNYEIDLFQDLIKAAAKVTGAKDLASSSLNVIADHIRACSFLITDGVIPGNEGRGYVLRRIIRRAIRHGYKLGQKQPFFHKLVADLSRVMGDAYPELPAAQQRVTEVLKQEEERFGETLVSGMLRFETAAKLESRVISYVRSHFIREYKNFEEQPSFRSNYRFDGVFHRDNEDVVVEVKRISLASNTDEFSKRFSDAVKQYEEEKNKATRGLAILIGKSRQVPEELIDLTNPNRNTGESEKVSFRYLSEDSVPFDGRDAFHLYDTFGFPLDLTQDLCREKGITVDVSAFDAAMDEQRERARAASKFTMQSGVEYSGRATEFHGYETLRLEGMIVALYKDGSQVQSVDAGADAVVVLDRTPFYAESGGQVGDRGEITSGNGSFTVADTQKIQAEVFGHKGKVKAGRLSVGDAVTAQVNPANRALAAYNHSATHLMHAALRKVLGTHVSQKGSLVDANRTRFDFSHNAPMTAEEIRTVENLVNREIRENHAVEAKRMKYDDAIKAGAMALFGEKYGDEVRVLSMGGFSTELCGGTHVRRTGDIGFFKIVSESGVASGIRRVEAVTANGALAWVHEQESTLTQAAHVLKAQPQELTQKLGQILDNVKSLEKELSRLKSKLASSQGDDLADQAVTVGPAKVLAAKLDGADAKTLRETLDKLKDKFKSAAIVLGAVEGGKVTLIAGVTSDLTAKVKAGDLVNFVAQQVGGKGGGRPDMAQAGGTDPTKLSEALDSVSDWVKQRIA